MSLIQRPSHPNLLGAWCALLALLCLVWGCGGGGDDSVPESSAPASETAGPEEAAEAEEPAIVTRLRGIHEEDPENGVVIYTLARYFDRQGRTEEALDWLVRLEKAAWDDVLYDADFSNSAALPDYRELADRLAARVVSGSEVAFELELPDLAPEGTAWDPRRREVLLSSGYRRTAVAVDANGGTRDVVEEAQDGLLAVLGMEVDRRDRLWVASSVAPFMGGYSEEQAGQAGVWAFDLESGATAGSWLAPEGSALFNDLTIAHGATAAEDVIYVTDSGNAVVRRLDPSEGTWTVVGPEGGPEAGPEAGTAGHFIGANGLALNGAGDSLFVADFLGLTRIDLGSGEAERLEPPKGVPNLGGIDGLAYGDGYLVGLQNVVGPGRVWKLTLDEEERQLAGAELLEAANPLFKNPTTGAIAREGGRDVYYFLANPQLQEAGNDGLGPWPEGGRFLLLRLPL